MWELFSGATNFPLYWLLRQLLSLLLIYTRTAYIHPSPSPPEWRQVPYNAQCGAHAVSS